MSILAEYKLEGFESLDKKLNAMGAVAGSRAMRAAAGYAMTPVVKQAVQTAPVGDKSHKTYEGRWVAPGFLSRSIRKKTTFNKKTGYVSAQVGVLREAFYGVTFLPKGIYGRSRGEKNTFLEDALEENTSLVLKRYQGRLKILIERAKRKK